jgi:uncharacterized protein YjiK
MSTFVSDFQNLLAIKTYSSCAASSGLKYVSPHNNKLILSTHDRIIVNLNYKASIKFKHGDNHILLPYKNR